MGDPANIRWKDTGGGEVLPPVAELIGERLATLSYTNLDGELVDLAYASIASRDPYPLPLPVDRENYGTVKSSPGYWATGLADWCNVKLAMERFCPAWNDRSEVLRLLDFGCASGRFLRHVHFEGEGRIDAWGCDYAPANVDWVKSHLPLDFKVFLNSAIPHLPFPDGYFHVVTAFSVFTHIDEQEDAWLLELRRITRPDGLLYLTVLNDAAWPRVLERPGVFLKTRRAIRECGQPPVTPGLFKGDIPDGRHVFKWSHEGVYNCDVWRSDECLKRWWGRFFHIHAIAANAHASYQSVMLLRPK